MATAMIPLSTTARKFVREWGDLGDRWGVDRSTAEVLALLYLAGEPIEAMALVDALGMDLHDVKTAIQHLREMGVARIATPAPDGQDRVECLRDPWDLFRRIAEERRRQEIEPALTVLRECVLRAESENDESVRKRLEEMQETLRLATGLTSQLGELTPAEARKLLRLGSRIRKILGAV